jgi:hypothetical protein
MLVGSSKQHVKYDGCIPASISTSEMNSWKKDPPFREKKHPLNPGYGGGRSIGNGLDNYIQDVHDYAQRTDLQSRLILMNDETAPPSRIATRKRPILQSRRHTAQVLISRIPSNK